MPPWPPSGPPPPGSWPPGPPPHGWPPGPPPHGWPPGPPPGWPPGPPPGWPHQPPGHGKPDAPPAKKPDPPKPGSGGSNEVKPPRERPIPIEQMLSGFKTHHRTTHVFKIDNVSLLAEYKIEKVSSSVFNLGGHKWKLNVYPNGSCNTKEYVSIYLENQDQVTSKLQYELFVICQLDIEWHNSGRKDFEASSPKTPKGVQKFISRDDLKSKGYLFGDCCMFGVTLHGFDQPATAECFSLIKNPPDNKVVSKISKVSSTCPQGSHSSNEFVVGNRKWEIKVYPKGFGTDKGKSLSMYLLAKEFIKNAPKTETFAKFKLRVMDQVNKKHYVEQTCSGWVDPSLGVGSFMPLEKVVEPYLVKDTMYVGVEFEVVSVTNYC